MRRCVTCPPGWFTLKSNRCLLFAFDPFQSMTWYNARTACQTLHAQPILINSKAEMIALQDQIENRLRESNISLSIDNVQQSVWITIDQRMQSFELISNGNNEFYIEFLSRMDEQLSMV
jgi:hypothetical protein